ncbi:MAG: cytochrome b/b6 domain-containing protein [Thermoleophilia bacterium]
MSRGIPPTREEHPRPAIIMHAVHMVSLVLLIFTGFYIHGPFFSGFMGYARSIHQVTMWTFLFTTIIRIYWSFFGAGSAPPGGRVKRRDFHWFSPLRHEGEGSARDTIKYYLFMRKTYPSVYKFNPLQKSMYLLWAFVFIPLITLTGLCLWTPTQSFFESFTYSVGGLGAMRSYHYLLMWIFICTAAIHMYLVIAEVARELPLMFAWREGKNAPPKQS